MKNTVSILLLLSALGCGSKTTTDKKNPSEVKPDVKPVASAPATKADSAPTSVPASTPAAALNLPPFNKEKQILFDARVDSVGKVTLDAAEKEKVLGALFSKYKKTRKECDKPEPGSKSTEEDIAAGQIAPEINTKGSGLFISPTEELTAYVVDVGECNAEETRDAPDTTSMIILMKGSEVKYKGDFSSINLIKAVDLDQNGTHEIVGISEFDGIDGGKYLSVHRFNGQKFESVGESSYSIFSDICLVAGEEGYINASVVSFTTLEQGKFPEIKEEKFSAPCGKPTQFSPSKD